MILLLSKKSNWPMQALAVALKVNPGWQVWVVAPWVWHWYEPRVLTQYWPSSQSSRPSWHSLISSVKWWWWRKNLRYNDEGLHHGFLYIQVYTIFPVQNKTSGIPNICVEKITIALPAVNVILSLTYLSIIFKSIPTFMWWIKCTSLWDWFTHIINSCLVRGWSLPCT